MTLTELKSERGKVSRTNKREFVRSKNWMRRVNERFGQRVVAVALFFFIWWTTTFQFSLANSRKFTTISSLLKWRWCEKRRTGGVRKGWKGEWTDFSFPSNRRCLKSFNQFLLPTSVNGRKMKKMKTIWCHRRRCWGAQLLLILMLFIFVNLLSVFHILVHTSMRTLPLLSESTGKRP